MTFELKGYHVLLLLVGFFGITIAVNTALATYAIETFSGEDVTTPYMRGLNYNKTLNEHAAQAALGWTASIAGERTANGAATLTVHIAAKDGAPEDGLAVEATLRRPTDARLDRTIKLSAVGNGVYSAATNGLAPGQWDVIARTTSGSGVAFEAERRMVLK